MQSFIGISHLLFMLQLVPAQIAPTTEAGPRVITFLELWAKSTCQPMEQLVDVEQEFPGETEYIYHPSCVPLHRCSGCCGDESKECRPTIIHNVTIELMRISPLQITKKNNKVPLTFVEHLGCECRAIIQEPPKKKRSVEVMIFYSEDLNILASSLDFAFPPQWQQIYQEQTSEKKQNSKQMWTVPAYTGQDKPSLSNTSVQCLI
ncbi:vascular endothelial growth factor A isoform X2 [Betta splendens]|uniref:Vascular endothelial growth factor A isoform X2 n=1 Tax=Betta splendens TaxID=158456 RepID=A0A6P7LS16_BETSP|nr:vascular endothelial growth factor A isoform X2 [Betta splendens]